MSVMTEQQGSPKFIRWSPNPKCGRWGKGPERRALRPDEATRRGRVDTQEKEPPTAQGHSSPRRHLDFEL